MAVDFASPGLSGIYGGRSTEDSWRVWCGEVLAPAGKDVADIGCGGGIYARGFASLGARSVVGIDRSPQYVGEAAAASAGFADLRFLQGTASATGLSDASTDLVFCRAVIHHLSASEQAAAAAEWLRVLRPGGVCAVQDRTFEDVTDPDPAYWIRSTLFECFPRLLSVEQARRPSAAAFRTVLERAGFAGVETLRFPETRKAYSAFADLAAEIMQRKGKSILFELSDTELAHYCDALAAKAGEPPLLEQDGWTVWLAPKA